MVKGRQYPAELRERAARLVQESMRVGRGEWEAMRSIAEKLGVGSPETVRKWVRTEQALSTPAGAKAAEDSDEVKRLKAENRELRRAKEILKAAAGLRSTFGPPLGRRNENRADKPIEWAPWGSNPRPAEWR